MKVTILGMGLMGAPMARRLHSGGFDVVAWNRSSQKLAPLKEAGILTMDSAQRAIAASSLTITMLSDAAAIRSALLTTPSTLQGKTVIEPI